MNAMNANTRAKAPGVVRIIGGQWRRTLLPVLTLPGLRPTPDRVRETLFNWLGQDLSAWRCLDAFGGTGALGFEAASRGAQSVAIVEQHPGLVAQLFKLQAKLDATAVRITRGDALATLRAQAPAALDLVFLDPPFDSPDVDLYPSLLQAAARAVRPGTWVYLEAPKLWDAAALAPFELTLHRHLKAGAVHAHLLQR
jgi:16S rRNA (guanine966-N2)-methyltransferase